MSRNLLPSLLMLVLIPAVPAGATPDSDVNPQTGFIETASEQWNGTDHNIIYTIDRSGLPPVTFDVATGTSNDIDPRVAIAPSGNATIVWTRDGSTRQVFSRLRDLSISTWGSIRQVSKGSEDSHDGTVAFENGSAWVAYLIEDVTETDIAALAITDEPDPIPERVIVATTEWTGQVSSLMHGESGHVWVTWVHNDSEVGYSEYSADAKAWSTPEFESYAESDVDGALQQIRALILGL